MKYILRKVVLGKVPEIEITTEEYDDLKIAKNILLNALAIEETYEIIIRSYIDFERQMLDTIIIHMVRRGWDYMALFEERLGLNIRLLNLLTACRLYVDQLPQNVRECIPNVCNSEEIVKEYFSKEYDRNKEYRFMEALRNYAQHRGIPVHWFQGSSRWTSLEDDGLMEYSIELASLRSYLEKDGKFKKEVLEEMDEKVDLKEATRNYIESLSNIQESVRIAVAESVKSSRKLIEDACSRYASVNSGNVLGLSACKRTDCGLVDTIPLLLDWDDVRLKLQQQNPKAINLKNAMLLTLSRQIINKYPKFWKLLIIRFLISNCACLDHLERSAAESRDLVTVQRLV